MYGLLLMQAWKIVTGIFIYLSPVLTIIGSIQNLKCGQNMQYDGFKNVFVLKSSLVFS